MLAHPYTYHSEDLMEELVAADKLDGIEVWRPTHSQEQIDALKVFAEQHNLLMTGGSDFHGMYAKTARPLGCQAPDDTVDKMRAYKAQKRRR